jgi:hypothetical protein
MQKKHFFSAIVFFCRLNPTFGPARGIDSPEREEEMNSKQVVLALRREKTLLEQVLQLAQCQLDLVQDGRIEDLEVLFSLRAEPMTDLAKAEMNLGTDMSRLENDRSLTPPELLELHDLNLEIINLANRIVMIDERAQQLAELDEFCPFARRFAPAYRPNECNE